MMSMHTLLPRYSRDLASIIGGRQLNTGDVVFHWDAAAGPVDRNVEASYAAAQPQSATVAGLIHWVSVRSSDRGAFQEIQTGDAIVTFQTEVRSQIEGRRELYFSLPDGNDYVQAVVGKKVMEFWDAIIGGQPLGITLLLKKKG